MGSTTLNPARVRSTDGGSRDGDGGRRDGYPPWGRVPARAYRTGIWVALGAITMLFAAFTSALLVRQGISNDWVRMSLPRILYLNTIVLLASSLSLEFARRWQAAGRGKAFAVWLCLTAFLGAAFVAGQLIAWRQLATRGIYLATSGPSSFFYLITAAHGVHLLGGIMALGYLAVRGREISLGATGRTLVDVSAIYWHFMNGLWLYLLVLLWTRT